jgi:hypothetical protein
MKTIQAHQDVGRFVYWFNQLCQKLFDGGKLDTFQGEAVTENKIGQYAFTKEGEWIEIPALTIDYQNGYKPNGSKAFQAFGIDFYLFRGLNYPEAKATKTEGTFRVGNTAEYIAKQVANSWVKLGGRVSYTKDYGALITIGKGDLWLSLYG